MNTHLNGTGIQELTRLTKMSREMENYLRQSLKLNCCGYHARHQWGDCEKAERARWGGCAQKTWVQSKRTVGGNILITTSSFDATGNTVLIIMEVDWRSTKLIALVWFLGDQGRVLLGRPPVKQVNGKRPKLKPAVLTRTCAQNNRNCEWKPMEGDNVVKFVLIDLSGTIKYTNGGKLPCFLHQVIEARKPSHRVCALSCYDADPDSFISVFAGNLERTVFEFWHFILVVYIDISMFLLVIYWVFDLFYITNHQPRPNPEQTSEEAVVSTFKQFRNIRTWILTVDSSSVLQ